MLSRMQDHDIGLDRKRDKKASRKMTRGRLLGEVWPEIAPSFQIHPGAKVFTIGSCFARNIEEHLQRLGFKIPMLDFKVPRDEWSPRPNGILNKYTPAAIFQEISWAKNLFLKGGAIGEADSMVFFYDCGDGSCIDTNLGGYVPVSRERYFQRRSQIYDTFKEAFSSDCVVITLGLIEAWFDREKGIYIQHAPVGKHFARNRARFAFERLSYDQSRRFVQNSINAIREVNKNAQFLLTVSPVPLIRTFTEDDVIVANAYSKSLLRAVAGEIAASNEYVDYFPGYETVMVTKNSDVWKPDLIHVSDAFVGKIVARLLETYCPGVEEARKLFQQSYTDLKAEDLASALELGRQAVENSPEDADLRKHFGYLLARKGDLKGAEEQFSIGVSLNPEDPTLHRQVSEVLARQGRFKDAIEAALRSLELAPNNEEFHRHLSRLWIQNRKLGKAAVQFAIASVHRRLERTKRPGLKRLLRSSLFLLRKMDHRLPKYPCAGELPKAYPQR